MRLARELTQELATAFASLPADTWLLQSAPKTVGSIVGGVDVLLQSVLSALANRTVMFPTFTSERSDPASWSNPPAPKALWERIRAEMPAFDPSRSSTRGMGQLVELLWREPEALRTAHPAESIAAIGRHAQELTHSHPLDDPMGIQSPWAQLVTREAGVLLLGVTLNRCSILHHAEVVADVPYLDAAEYLTFVDLPVSEGEIERCWISVRSGGSCSEGFNKLLPQVQTAGLLQQFQVGDATTWVLPAKGLVELTVHTLRANPGALLCDRTACFSCSHARNCL